VPYAEANREALGVAASAEFEHTNANATTRCVVVERRVAQRIREAVERIATGIAVTAPAIQKWLETAALDLSLFMSDTLQWVLQLERFGEDAPILQSVLSAFPKMKTPQSSSGPEADTELHAPREPLLVVTHSMGAAIFYKIFTQYRPDLRVDCWISIGSQISQFQVLGLFDQNSSGPITRQVTGLKPQIKRWFNIFDEHDSLTFLANPIFPEAEDLCLSTQGGPSIAHSGYLQEEELYAALTRLILEALEERTSPGPFSVTAT
jgi:hypothetical protein